ncbi:MAG: ribonuclease E/G, partial [Alphaproteobacteria bacterium]
MAKRMLVDASHLEETRVVILDGNKVEEFDYESASRRPLKGNIYLAKVTRVEPSLQACFVEYGGNRHGFLAFSEIHPDYYQIPTADRQALLEAARADERYSDDDSSEAESEENEAPSGPDDGANGEPFEAAAREGEGENEPEIVEVVAEEGDDVW